ncbi:MAG: aspartate aminotransferase family protein [Myxococcota bacterium]|nr:aspartate aminotransferase family protein [Myxococcota bacterium]MEC9390875.1 aspartate aminotransferase family protein [Myxococcota bacterium]
MSDGTEHPRVVTAVPGPISCSWVDRLAERECPAITARRARRASALGTQTDDPIVWDRALGANVWDVDGNRFVDLTAGFGVASVGHRNPAVVAAAAAQLNRLTHVMGDAFPDTNRIVLLERLAELTGLDRAILGSSGSDGVEAALKTGRMLSGRSSVMAFSGGYHGLSYGALSVSAYNRSAFRQPFEQQLGSHVQWAEFGGEVPDLSGIGTVIVEPVQGRGGIRVPPAGWLGALADKARSAGAVLVFDEVYTGFGRTGDWFAYQDEAVRPDVLVLGKGMAGGFPISVAIGTAEAMDAWGASEGQAIHTQTFLGHPVGCAMALACIRELETVVPSVTPTGEWLRAQLVARGHRVRGRGLMLGVELPDTLAASRALLQRGYIALPSGEQAEVLAVTPPLTIARTQLEAFLQAFDEVVA